MPKCYAIVPAAGRSRRMGAPKLLLPWPTKERPEGLLMDQVLAAWTASAVSRIVVIVRHDDEPLIEACQRWEVDLLTPREPLCDMTASIQAGLQYIESTMKPQQDEGCFIGPSDVPNLHPQVIDGMWRHAVQDWPSEMTRRCVWTPTFGGQSGHPALLPWFACGGIHALPSGTGADSYIRTLERRAVAFPVSMMVDDCDTPEQYRRALKDREANP